MAHQGAGHSQKGNKSFFHYMASDCSASESYYFPNLSRQADEKGPDKRESISAIILSVVPNQPQWASKGGNLYPPACAIRGLAFLREPAKEHPRIPQRSRTTHCR